MPSAAIRRSSSSPKPSASPTPVFGSEVVVHQRRIVGVDRDEEAGVEHRPKRMVLEPGYRFAMTMLLSGRRSSGSVARRPVGRGRDRRRRDAVVDPLGAEDIERDPDVVGPDADRFPGVARPPKPESAAAVERRREGARSMPSSVESAPTPMTRSRAARAAGARRAPRRTRARGRARTPGRYRAMSGTGRRSSASAASMPSARPATIDPEILAGGQMPRRRKEHLAVSQAVGARRRRATRRRRVPSRLSSRALLDQPEHRQERIE